MIQAPRTSAPSCQRRTCPAIDCGQSADAGCSAKSRRCTRICRAVPLFVGSYLAVWTLVGVAVYAL
jgi:hypothetical protein